VGVSGPPGTDPHWVLHGVFVNAEGLIFRRGRICWETFALPQYAEEYRQPTVYSRFILKNYWLRRGAFTVPSALWVIDNVSNNYFHWTVESLTRLLRAERCFPEQRVLLLPNEYRRLSYVPHTLRAFPQVQRVGWVSGRGKVRVEDLELVPRLPRQPPERLPDREELAEVVRRVAAITGRGTHARRLYFSRADASRRRVRNEEALVRVLREYDFEILEIDPAKPWEQIQLSLGADLMVGVHGAALTNLLYMPQGARLLELRDSVHHWTLYRKLADLVGIEYHSQECEPAEGRDRPGDQHMDLLVDPDQLRENLRDLVAA